MWFNDEDDEQQPPFGLMMGGGPKAPMGGIPAADPSEMQRMQAAMAMASLASLFSVDGNNNAMKAVQQLGAMRSQQRRMQGQQQLQQGLTDIFRQGQAGAQPTIPIETASPGFEPGAGESPESIPNPRDPKTVWSDMYRKAGDYMASVGMSREAKHYWDRSAQLMPPAPKFSTTPQVVQTPEGPRLALFDEQGNHKFVDGALPQRKVGREITVQGPNGPIVKLVDEQGNDIRQEEGYVAPVAVDQGDRTAFVRPGAGVELPKNLSPGQAEQLQMQAQGLDIQRGHLGIARGNLGVSQGNLNLSQQRLGLERDRLAQDRATAEQGRIPVGYRRKADGTLEAVPGGPADGKSGPVTEGERNAAGYADRMTSAEQIINQVSTANPNAQKPGFIEQATGGTGMIANASRTPERQMYRQAQEDWVRAKLRKESGAVIASDEMEREISVYFPQIGDGPKVIAQKADARKIAEASMRKAGGRAVNTPPTRTDKPEGSWEPGTVVEQLPTNAKRGARVRDRKTGQVLQFDGKQWKPTGG